MLCVAALTTTYAAQAANLFLTSGSYDANDATYQSDYIFVGLDSSFSSKDASNVPYIANLNVLTGGSVKGTEAYNTSTVNISDGSVSYAFAYNTSTINISGGSVGYAFAYNTSTTNISGGSVGYVTAYSTNTVNISNGSVNYANAYDTSTTNISGGSVGYAIGRNTSTTNISGGTLTNGFLLNHTTATVNFIGTSLTGAYQSYGYNSPYNTYADFFQVSGIIGGTPTTYDLYIRNENGSRGPTTPNRAARGFTFNGGMPVIVPEMGTLALLLPSLTLLGMVARRKK